MPNKLYEHPEFQAATGGVLRPGGLELTGEMLNAAALPPGAPVLDVGCGLGVTAAFLKRCGFVPCGIDSSEANLQTAKSLHPQLDLRLGDALFLPWAPGSFQGILCECSFSLFPRPEAVLREFARVLHPGGKLLISDLYRRSAPEAPGREYPSGTCMAGAWPLPALFALLESAGFHCLAQHDVSPLLHQFTARMVWEFGSLNAFWGALFPPPPGALPACAPATTAACGVKRPTLGYAWSIWELEEKFAL